MAKVFSVTSVQLHIMKSNPPQILVVAHGMAATSGWKNIDLVPVEDSAGDGILDLDFVGTPPTGLALQVLTPVTGDFVIEKDAEKLAGVLVHARSNSMSALVAGGGDPTNPGGPSPGVDRFTAAGFGGPITTFAIGEEGPIGTAALGETLVVRPGETFAWHQAETLPFQPAESLVALPGEKLPILETDPLRDLGGGVVKPGFGEGGPGPDPGPFIRTPFGS